MPAGLDVTLPVPSPCFITVSVSTWPTVSHEVAVATAPIDSPIGPIAPGHIAAQKFCWEATVRGEPVITVRTNWFMGDEHLDPAWTFGPEGERFEVAVTGDPSSQVTFRGWQPASIEIGLERNPGIVATATHCVSAVPAVVGAQSLVFDLVEQ